MKFRIAVSNIEEALKQLASHPKMTISPMNYRSETGQPFIIEIILDISHSTEEFHEELIDSFNTVVIPSVADVAQRYRWPIRLNCLLFSKGIIPAWYGFKTLEELGPNPLKQSLLNWKGLQNKTALYKAVRSGIIWTAAAMDHMRNTGRGEVPKGKLIVLTDGANDAYPKKEVAIVKTLDSIGKINQRNLQLAIGFFKTSDGLTEQAFEIMAERIRFKSLDFHEIARDVSTEERKATFRRQMNNLFR